MGTEVTALASFRSVTYDTYANFPTSPAVEDLAYATDRRALYRWSGAAWEHMSQYHFYGIAADKPAAADLPGGSTYFETDTGKTKQVQAGAWVTVVTLGVELSMAASDVLRNSNDAEKGTQSLTYVKVKECLLNADLPACRIKFDLRNNADAYVAYGKIYKNGVAIGTERTNNTWTTVTFSQDFTGFVSGDLIQIYAKQAQATHWAYVSNMRFYYTQVARKLGGSELVSPLATLADPTISVTNQDP